MGYNSKHGWNTERFTTNPAWSPVVSCFFIGAGINSLPFASTLHSYVPIIASKKSLIKLDTEQKYKIIFHILPLSTTLLISFTTLEKIRLKRVLKSRICSQSNC